MTVPVANAGSLVNKVPAVEVVLIAVCIVVGILGSVSLALVGPDVVVKVGVSYIHTGIKDCYDRAFVGDYFLCPYILEVYGIECPLLLEEWLILVFALVIIGEHC